jgi:hypothetical protein
MMKKTNMKKTMMKKISACQLCNGNCQACYYADVCGIYNDVNVNVPLVSVYKADANMALCEGRHAIPQATDGAIFGNSIDPLDVDGLEAVAKRKLSGLDSLNLYVTGLTVALVAVLNATRELGISVTLYHYNRENGDYYPQEVK